MAGILSDEFKNSVIAFTMRVREDTEGNIRTLIAIFGVYSLLMIIWWANGKILMGVYASNWLQRYPGVPLSESYTMQVMLVLDAITWMFFILSWAYIFVYLTSLAISEPEVKKKAAEKKEEKIVVPNGSGGWDEHNIPEPTTEDCPHCNSSEIRDATGKNKGKKYCMSCRKYF